MTTKIGRENLLRTLEYVSPGLSTRDIIEQSTSFVFKGGQVITYNDEVSCRGPSGLDEGLTGAVRADKLLDLLRKLPDDELDIGLVDSEFNVMGSRKESGIPLEKEVRLPLANVEEAGGWRELNDSFTEAVEVVHQCAGKDESQPELTCVHITSDYLEACDNFQLCRWKMDTGFTEELLVKQSSLRHVVALNAVEFSDGKAWVHFRNALGFVLSCRRKKVSVFPDLSELLNTVGEPFTLPKGLEEVAARAEIFAKDNPAGAQVLVQLNKGKLSVRGRGPSGWYRESKKVSYSGQPLSFNMAPPILVELAKRHTECVVNEQRLHVDGGAYCYISCLTAPEE